MQCYYPRYLRPGKKDPSGYKQPGEVGLYVPCGKCLPCRINRRREWTQRLLHESYYASSAYFITLTYDEEHVPIDENGNEAVSKEDVQHFIQDLRNYYRDLDICIRYFIGSEYGPETGRPHYHAIIYNLPDDILEPCRGYIPGMALSKDKGSSMINRKINDIWKRGFCTIGALTRQRCGYCAKYFVDKQNVDEIQVPNFNLMSRRPGIGSQHADGIKDKVRYFNSHSLLTDNGKYIAMPRYYGKKIYTDEERESRWRDHVDEINSRFVDPSNPVNTEVEMVQYQLHRALTFKGKKSKI